MLDLLSRDWLSYHSRAGIVVSLVNYPGEDAVDGLIEQAWKYAKNSIDSATRREYEQLSSVMILDTFLADSSDKRMLREVFKNRRAFSSIKILMVNPSSSFAKRQPSLQIERTTSENKLCIGLRNILSALGYEQEISNQISSIELVEIIHEEVRLREHQIDLKFYDLFPYGPMYFFRDILVCGRFGVGKDCMKLPWFMIVDDPNRPDDLFDQNRDEFQAIWSADSTKDLPTSSAETQRFESRDKPEFDIALVCALPEELKAVRKMGQLSIRDWKIHRLEKDPQEYVTVDILGKNGRRLSVVAACPTQMGLTAAASLTTKMLLAFSPRMVVMVGIAAGTKKVNRGYGDVLVAQQAIDYLSGKRALNNQGNEVFRPDSKPLSISDSITSRLHRLQQERAYLSEISDDWDGNHPGTRLNIHIGNMASGDQVRATGTNDIEEHWRKLIGVEMETYGVYYAASKTSNNPPLFLSFKSVCDFADPNKSDGWRGYAAYTSSQYCYRFLVNDAVDLLTN